MGVAIASAAWRRGGSVTLIAGPLEVDPPPGVTVISVETTEEMAEAVARIIPSADALIMAAAPADFRASHAVPEKLKKANTPPTLELTATRDILAHATANRGAGTIVVGFALETNDLVANARAKLDAKQLDLIVANSAREDGAGFAVDTNRVTMIAKDGTMETLPLMTKADVADVILDRVEALLRAR
jgi:phosphopantothenoylcysteine decarboxylase/phosphopantothenate--cysteine ligase